MRKTLRRTGRLYCSPDGLAVLCLFVGVPAAAVVVLILIRWILKRWLDRRIAAAIGMVVAIAVAAPMFLGGIGRMRELCKRSCCQSNMHQFDLALQAHCYPPITNYPASLAQLSPNDVSPKLYMCPSDPEKTIADNVANTEDHSSYIYVANLSLTAPPDMPVILCPNHENGGNVLWIDHSTQWLPDSKFDALTDNLYADTNLPILVSDALTKRSNGRYYSRP